MARRQLKTERPACYPKPIWPGGRLGSVDVQELRRVQLARETLGYLAIPLLYGALMAAGVFLYKPELAVFTLILVLLLILQARAGRIASTIAARAGDAGRGPQAPARAVAAADQSVLAFVTYSTAASMAGYLVFLAALDLTLHMADRGEPGGLPLVLGTLAGIAIVVVGKDVARRLAWRGFAAQFPDVWQGPGGMDRGKRVRTAGQYLDWRMAVNDRA
jgi:hypothetical protein